MNDECSVEEEQRQEIPQPPFPKGDGSDPQSQSPWRRLRRTANGGRRTGSRGGILLKGGRQTRIVARPPVHAPCALLVVVRMWSRILDKFSRGTINLSDTQPLRLQPKTLKP